MYTNWFLGNTGSGTCTVMVPSAPYYGKWKTAACTGDVSVGPVELNPFICQFGMCGIINIFNNLIPIMYQVTKNIFLIIWYQLCTLKQVIKKVKLINGKHHGVIGYNLSFLRDIYVHCLFFRLLTHCFNSYTSWLICNLSIRCAVKNVTMKC